MRVIKVDHRCYLVEWKYKDFLRVGHQFQGQTILKLERYEQFGSDYVKVTVEATEYKI